MKSPLITFTMMVTTIVLCLSQSACSSLTFLVVNTPATLSGAKRIHNVVYAEASRHTLDIYRPVSPQTSAVPVVIFIHGGNWTGGSKDEYRFVGSTLAEQGYLAVLPAYGLYPAVRFPTFVEDIAKAVRWVHEHAAEYGGDPQRLYIMGHSAGAHIAALMALNPLYLQQVGGDPRWIAGFIGLSGPYDFLPFTYPYMNELFGPPEKFQESQPIHFVHEGSPRTLLLHGLQDHVVAPTNTRYLYEALQKAGNEVTVEFFENATHSDLVAAFSFIRKRKPPVLARIQQFIDVSD